jgi:hypothetical protein
VPICDDNGTLGQGYGQVLHGFQTVGAAFVAGTL